MGLTLKDAITPVNLLGLINNDTVARAKERSPLMNKRKLFSVP